MTLFESVQAKTPDAIESLDGLKIQIVYLETGHTDKFLNLERWLIARYKSPKVSTDAERSVKGYLIWKGATDPTILGHALEMTRFARERAVASGEGEYQGFFDTAYGIALYRLGRYGEAAKWLPGQLGHQDVLVRTLALGFTAMNEFKLGNRAEITRADGPRAKGSIQPAETRVADDRRRLDGRADHEDGDGGGGRADPALTPISTEPDFTAALVAMA